MVYIMHVHLCGRIGQLQNKKSFQIWKVLYLSEIQTVLKAKENSEQLRH